MQKPKPYPISWTQERWNPIVGCTKVSPGCQNCWAERMACRTYPIFKKGWTDQVLLRPDRLDKPSRWPKPRMIAVCLMGDLFHQAVPDEYIFKVFAEMVKARRHTFQVLTKRPKRLWELSLGLVNMAQSLGANTDTGLPPNIWIGISAEDQPTLVERTEYLIRIPAALHFVSLEPLLGPVRLFDYIGPYGPPQRLQQPPQLDWIVVGGESGPRARPMHPAWPTSLRDEAVAAGIPFHFKQWGSWKPCPSDCQATNCRVFDDSGQDVTNDHTSWQIKNVAAMRKMSKTKAGRLLDAVEYLEMPRIGEDQK